MSSFARKQRRAKERLGDVGVRYGGRTVEVRVFLNTDETVAAVVERLRKAAQGPNLKMALLMGSLSENASELWETVAKSAERQVVSDIEKEN